MFSCIILCCIISCYERLTSFYEVSRRCAFARVSDKTFCCWFWQNIYCLRFISSFMYMVEGNGLIYTTIQWCVTFYLKYKIHKMTRCPLSQFSLKSVYCDTTWSSWLIYHMYNVSPISPLIIAGEGEHLACARRSLPLSGEDSLSCHCDMGLRLLWFYRKVRPY